MMWQESEKDREEALERRTQRLAREDGVRRELADEVHLEDRPAGGDEGRRAREKE
jgi:hypothetical protein